MIDFFQIAPHMLTANLRFQKLILYIYTVLFLGPQSTSHMEGGNLLSHHQCAASTWMMRRQPYCARTATTHQLIGGEETK